MKNITGSIRVEKHHRKASILKSGSCRLHERPILIFSALFVLGIAAVHAQDIGQLGASAYPMSAPPAMTPAVAQTNALANPVVWQRYQEAAAKAAAAAYLQISTTNQGSAFASANSSNLQTQNQIKMPMSGRISIQGSKAIGQGGPHTAEFAADLNSPVVVNLTMADGEQLQSHVLGLGYYTTDGKSVLIAGIKDSIGELLPPNQIIYRDAFDGINADVVYTYTAYSVEQDIILRQQIPTPSQYNLDSEKAQLSVMTAFTKTPEPLQMPEQIDLSAYNRAAGVRGPASLSDEQILFKNMRMIQGRSFSLGDSASAIPSSKSWLKIGGSHFLVESTPYALIEPLLSSLPPYTAAIQPHKTQSLAAMLLHVPKPAFAQKKHQIQLSRSEIKRPGVILDYLIVSSPVLDINFGGYATNKVGFAATGQTTNDYWNGFNFGGKTSGTVYDLKWVDQNYSGINVTVQNAPGWWANNTGDGMYDPYIYPWNGGNVTVTLSTVPAGTYDFYLYGHSVNACENSKFQITVGSNTTTWKQTQDSTFAGTSTNWTEGAQYVVFRSIAVSSGQSVIITCAPGDCGAAILNGLQMVSDVTGQPIIQAQPQGQCVWLGSNATLAVTAFGTTPLNYQWQHNGVNIAGATAATLNVTDVQFEDGGTYTVTVNNSFGSVTSAGAVLRVLSESSALLNVDFTGSTQGKTGLAATGLATNDFWNEYRNTGNAGAITMTNLQWADGVTSSLSCISMTVSNAPGTWGNNTGDGMYDVYIYPWNGGNAVVTLTNLPANSYDFYLYGHGNTPQSNAKFQVKVGNTTTVWAQTQDSTFAATSSNWVEGVQYVVFRNIAVAAGQAVTVGCAPGDSGVAIFNGIQLLVSEPFDATDRDGDGLPDNWETGYFGYLTNQNASTLDGNGNTLLYDYQNGVNPTAITFSIQVTNNYANNMSVPAQLAVQGVPYYQAILVDDTNFAHAVWVPCTSYNPTINLGSTEGWHNVLIGLKAYCTDAYEVWQGKRLKLDLTPPWLTITNPVSDLISQPMIQLNGYSAEALGSIRYDITNATGLLTNQDVLVLNQLYDTNTWEFTTNTFQAFDIPLTNGLNIITVHAADLAGNTMTTNFNFTLDYSGKTNPPAIQLYWPQDGAAICGSSFTWRGWISDFTATVTAQAVDSSGNTNIVEAVVERDGNFWVENLPLSSGSSLLTLTATDAAGNVAVTNITVSTSGIGLTINPPDSSQFWNQSMTVYGSINSTDYTVWVNGVKATLNGTSWEADNVPNTPGGTAVFQARAIPNTDNGGNGTGSSGGNAASYDNMGNPHSIQAFDAESQIDRPTRLYIESYHSSYTANNDNAYSDAYYADGTSGASLNESDDVEYSVNWTDQQAANGSYTESFDYKASWLPYDEQTWQHYDLSWPATAWPTLVDGSLQGTYWYVDGSTGERQSGPESNTAEPPPVNSEHCNQSGNLNASTVVMSDDGARGNMRDSLTYNRTAEATWKLQTGGKGRTRRQNLFVLSASAQQAGALALHPYWDGDFYAFWDFGPWSEVSPTQITIVGQSLGLQGQIYAVLPDDTEVDVTPKVSGVDYYTFNIGAGKCESVFCVYVCQPYPYYPSDASWYGPYGPPLGYPVWKAEVNGGHAWWMAATTAPNEAVSKFVINDASQWNEQEEGYGPVTGLDWWDALFSGTSPSAPGELPFPYGNTATVQRTYGIGFPGLVSALNHTEALHEHPGIWALRTHNCVTETIITGDDAGLNLPAQDWLPEYFGFDLPPNSP